MPRTTKSELLSQILPKLSTFARNRVQGLQLPKKYGDLEFEKFVQQAHEQLLTGDPRAVKLGVDQLRYASSLVAAERAKLLAEREEKQNEVSLLKADWEAKRDPSQTPPKDDQAHWDRLAKDARLAGEAALELDPVLAELEQSAELGVERLPTAGTDGDPVVAKLAADLREVARAQGAQAMRYAKRHELKDATPHADLAQAAATVAEVIDPIGSTGRPVRTQAKRAAVPKTVDTPLWLKIRRASLDLGWERYEAFLNGLSAPGNDADRKQVQDSRIALPFPDVDPYRYLKAATEVFLMTHCATVDGPTPEEDLEYAERRLGVAFGADEIERAWEAYLRPTGDGDTKALPYLALIRSKLSDAPLVEWSEGQDVSKALAACSGILRRKLTSPCLVELIWSYWLEEGMLVQTMNAITRRFQNVRTPGDRDPLAAMEIDPLRPLNNFLWGYLQDEQHRLTVQRRAYEYDHHYGLKLIGRAIPAGIRGADSRAAFIEALHNLLHLCTIFFKEDDDTNFIADGFPVLNALRDVHIILSQGAHNQFGDLPWTARHEMLMQQWLLGRPEMREFLPTRVMVAYPERWMDRVDAMKGLMGWSNASILHFRDLAVFGERILLGARFNNWTEVIEPERAANWARFWRPEIQGYIHAYRAVAGVDLGERAEATMPSTLLRNRLATSRGVLAR